MPRRPLPPLLHPGTPMRSPRPVLAASLLTLALTGGSPAADLRYAEDQAPGIVQPLFATTMAEARINELIFEGLYTDDRDLATRPDLAASSQLSADRTEMTIRLRPDARWHDGQPVTARDVVFTIQAMKDPATASTEPGRVEWIESATVVDDLTVRLRFQRAEARPEDKLNFKILPAHRFSSTSVKRSDPFRSRPIGSGPFQLIRYNDDGSISMSRVDGHRDNPQIEGVVMREVSDKGYQAKLLIYESLEVLVRVLPRDLATLQANRKIELHPYQTNSWWYLGFNLGQPTLADARVRRALALMLDSNSLLAPIGTGELLSGPFVRSSPFYNHEVPPLGRDLDRAAALLTEAGYTKTAQGWSRGGRPLSLKVSAHKSLESAQEVVINLQSQLQSQGVRVEVEFLDEVSWRANIWRERRYDLVLSQWSFDRNEDIREQFHSQGSRNFTGYRSPEVDRLLDRARDTLDPQEKKQALRQVHALVHKDMPMHFLWTLDSYAAMSTKVGNVVVHPFYFFTWATDWTLR